MTRFYKSNRAYLLINIKQSVGTKRTYIYTFIVIFDIYRNIYCLFVFVYIDGSLIEKYGGIMVCSDGKNMVFSHIPCDYRENIIVFTRYLK